MPERDGDGVVPGLPEDGGGGGEEARESAVASGQDEAVRAQRGPGGHAPSASTSRS